MTKSKKRKTIETKTVSRVRRTDAAKSKRRSGLYRTTQVMLRVTLEEKKCLRRGAAREGKSLSAWLRRLALQRVKQLKLTAR